ncbi:Protein of unknown function [Bacillus thuringiensis]|uniref:Uncharacterized protein n=1 Tax=Bacillus thuringiensis TaxID=1428 RepID=A0A1C4DD52_BACTU|nr:Protein of unknown function [Bacillus thuringiensis]
MIIEIVRGNDGKTKTDS